MKADEMAELMREEQLILAWIRDVTARKQGRLMKIRAKLKRLSRDLRQNGEIQNPSETVDSEKVVPEFGE